MIGRIRHSARGTSGMLFSVDVGSDSMIDGGMTRDGARDEVRSRGKPAMTDEMTDDTRTFETAGSRGEKENDGEERKKRKIRADLDYWR